MKKIKKVLMFLYNIIIPGSDSDFNSFQKNATPYLDTNKVRLSLELPDVTALLADKLLWDALYTKLTDPLQRTPAVVQEKDTLRFAYETLLRKVIAQAKTSNALTPSDRTELNLPDPNEPRTPINAPVMAPVLTLNSILHLRHVLRIQDPDNPTSRKKPFGVASTEVFYFMGAAPPPSVSDYKSAGKTGRFLFTVQFTLADVGNMVWYIARYYNPRGEAGPWSEPVNGTVA